MDNLPDLWVGDCRPENQEKPGFLHPHFGPFPILVVAGFGKNFHLKTSWALLNGSLDMPRPFHVFQPLRYLWFFSG